MPNITKANPFGCALVKLPKLPSALILLALRDLALVERSKIYDVDMGEWHETGEDKERGMTCTVCFAGAVMARTLKAPINESIPPHHVSFKSHNFKKLIALDEFRVGCIHRALISLDRKYERIYLLHKHEHLFVKIEDLSCDLDYERDRGQFKRIMRRIAGLLEKMGL